MSDPVTPLSAEQFGTALLNYLDPYGPGERDRAREQLLAHDRLLRRRVEELTDATKSYREAANTANENALAAEARADEAERGERAVEAVAKEWQNLHGEEKARADRLAAALTPNAYKCQHNTLWPSLTPPADDCIWATSDEQCVWERGKWAGEALAAGEQEAPEPQEKP